MYSPQSTQTSEHLLEEAASALQQGQLVAFPTDTLYALGAHAFIERAVRNVYRVKQRHIDMGLPLLLAKPTDIEKVGVDIPQIAWDLAEEFWPGALTLVLQKGPSVLPCITAGKGTVAVRVPNHRLALQLIEATGAPLTGTSANRSGGKDPVTALDVSEQLGQAVGVILDEGACPMKGASSIVDLTTTPPRIIRTGVIPYSTLKKVCPDIRLADKIT